MRREILGVRGLPMSGRGFTPWKPSKAQLLAARNKLVPDLVAKNLIVLFAGINPGRNAAGAVQSETPRESNCLKSAVQVFTAAVCNDS